MRLPPITRSLTVAAAAFGIYGVVAGVFVKEADFFPASVLNYRVFMAAAGFPIQVLRALFAIVAAGSIIRLLDVFRWETQENLRVSELRWSATIASAMPVFLFMAIATWLSPSCRARDWKPWASVPNRPGAGRSQRSSRRAKISWRAAGARYPGTSLRRSFELAQFPSRSTARCSGGARAREPHGGRGGGYSCPGAGTRGIGGIPPADGKAGSRCRNRRARHAHDEPTDCRAIVRRPN